MMHFGTFMQFTIKSTRRGTYVINKKRQIRKEQNGAKKGRATFEVIF